MPKLAKPLPVLTDIQKAIIEADWQMDLVSLTRKVFSDQSIDLRRVEIKAVKAYLATIGKNPDLSPKKLPELTSEQKEFVKASYKDNNPVEVARTLFSDPKLMPGHERVRMVLNYIREIDPEYRKEDELVDDIDYRPPATVNVLIGRLNRYGVGERPNGDKLATHNMSGQDKKQLDALMSYIRRPVFKVEADKFIKRIDREVFESVFLSTCWDKPDLTPEHVIQYIQLASLTAQRNQADRLVRVLDERFIVSLEDAGQRLSKPEVDALNATKDKATEHLKQISALIKTLMGERSKLMDAKHSGAASMLPLVEAWRQKESRDKIISLAQKKQNALRQEVDRFASMDAIKAELLGLDPDTILY